MRFGKKRRSKLDGGTRTTDVMIERRSEIRYRVILPALCSRAGRADFYAVTDDISASGVRFKSSTPVELDEALVCRIRHVGALDVRVVRTERQTFVGRLTTRRPAADAIALKLVLMARRQEGACEQIRAAARITPLHRDTTVTLAHGGKTDGRVLNVSATGASLLLDRTPRTGDLILVGETPARVMRQFQGGCGVAFISPFDAAEVDESLVL